MTLYIWVYCFIIMEMFYILKNHYLIKVEKALFHLYSKIHDDCFNHETLISLFDTYISCILCYGCEIWGSHIGVDVENVHLNFLKRTLKVRRSAVNVLITFILKKFIIDINLGQLLVSFQKA